MALQNRNPLDMNSTNLIFKVIFLCQKSNECYSRISLRNIQIRKQLVLLTNNLLTLFSSFDLQFSNNPKAYIFYGRFQEFRKEG